MFVRLSFFLSKSILENFISKKGLVCYGGTAINNILPERDQFYNKELEIPDYDCFSMNAMNDAKELADIYFKEGFTDVEAKMLDKAYKHLGIPAKINRTKDEKSHERADVHKVSPHRVVGDIKLKKK